MTAIRTPWEPTQLREFQAEFRANPGLAADVENARADAKEAPPARDAGGVRGPTQWPDPPASEAFHGLAGDIVGAIQPHSEADPVAILVQVLTGFGNVVGRDPFFQVEADRHGLNLFTVLVGASGKSRKGTSRSQAVRPFRHADPDWLATRNLSGLSSGEGLIWVVRDPIKKHERIREKGRVVGYEDVVADPGISDKRLLVFESEFVSVLKMFVREGFGRPVG